MLVIYQVACATTSPAKVQTILQTFHEIFGKGSCRIASVTVESGVPEQPFGNEETYAGARNRVANARRLLPEADPWVVIEAGTDGGSTFSWVVTENTNQCDKMCSAILPLPAMILEKVRESEALGPVMSRYTGTDEIGRREGAVGVFAVEKLTRASVYHQAVTLALSLFHNTMYQPLQARLGVHAASGIQCMMPGAPRPVRPTKSIAFQRYVFQSLTQLDGRGFQTIRSTRNRHDARAEFIS